MATTSGIFPAHAKSPRPQENPRGRPALAGRPILAQPFQLAILCDTIGLMRARFTSSARRHRIGRTHALHVMNTATRTFRIGSDGETRTWWIGEDDRGLELEVMGFEGIDTKTYDHILLIIHVMPTSLRRK